MKKRMIAILLSISVLCSSLFFVKRASAAAGTVGAIVTIGCLAWNLIGVFTGKYDDAAEAIGYVMSEGWDGLTNPDSAFQQNWKTGWESICDTVSGWFDSGDIELGQQAIKLRHEQILQLYRQLVNVVAPSVDFHADYPAYFLNFDFNPVNFPVGSLPTADYLLNVFPGQTYALCYNNPKEGKLVFSDYYINLYYDGSSKYLFDFNYLDNSYLKTEIGGVSTSIPDYFDNPDVNFSFPSFASAEINYSTFSSTYNKSYETSNCFVFSNGILTYTPISEVDLSGFNAGVVSTVADYGAFLKSLIDFSVSKGDIGALDDLSDVIPDDASLSFPANPDLDKPLADQIIVGDVAGAEDLPLSDYLNNVIDFDISVPSVILTKFPFCIPYDFVRFLGVLAADPIPPVFHIPISTHPKNLEQWADNETIGQYVFSDDPMFDIDEDIVLDFAHIPLVQPICYTVFIVGFVILLIRITPKMIQH